MENLKERILNEMVIKDKKPKKSVHRKRKGLLLTYALIKFEGKPVGRIERAYFPDVTKASRKYVEFHGLVEIEEEE